MQQLEFFAIPSPCIGVCESGPKGFCRGCFRSRDERLHWQKVDAATKRAIVKACIRRKRQYFSKASPTDFGVDPQQSFLLPSDE